MARRVLARFGMVLLASSCVLPPPPPEDTATPPVLAIDRQKVIPLAAGTVHVVRGTPITFDLDSAIANPDVAQPIYASWWLGFDPADPQRSAEELKNGTRFELTGCEGQLLADGAVTSQLEALISTANRIILDPAFVDQRVGPAGEQVIIVQWTLEVSGDEAACTQAGGVP